MNINNIIVALQEKNYHQVVILSQNFELELEERFLFDSHDYQLLLQNFDFYGYFLLALIFDNNLTEAKYLWNRAPELFKTDRNISSISSLWEVAKHLWTNRVDLALNSLSQVEWTNDIKPHIDRLNQHLMCQQIRSLSNVSNNLTLDTLEQKLGVPKSTIAQVIEENNGSFDSTGNLILPSSFIEEETSFNADLQQTLDLLHRVTNYASNLDIPLPNVELSGTQKSSK